MTLFSKPRARFATVLAATLVASSALAQDEHARVLIDRVLAITTARAAIADMSAQVVAIAADDPKVKRLDRAAQARAAEAARAASTPAALLETLNETMARGFDEQRYRGFLVKYQGPLVKKMIDLESSTARSGTPEARQRFTQQLSARRPPKERVDALDKLDELLQSTENVAEVNLFIATRFELPDIDASNPAQREKFAQMRQAIGRQTENMVLTNLLFVYQDASQKEIDDYVKLVSDEDVTYTLRIVASALTDAMLVALRNAFRATDELVK
jgi:hypothetical protein